MSKQIIASFNPASTSSGSFKASVMAQNRNPQTGLYGYLLWANESPVSLIVQVNTDIFRIHPWQLEKIELTQFTDIVYWSQEFTLSNSSSAPASLCLVDGYTSDETVAGSYPIQLVRSVGAVTTAFQAQELIALSGTRVIFPDDQTVPGTIFIEPNQYPAGTNAPIDIGLVAKQNGTTDQEVLVSDVTNLRVLMKLALGLELNTGQTLSGIQVLSGTGPGTVSHSLGVTPAFAVLSPTNGAAAAGVGNYTPTTVTAQCASGVTWKIFLFA